MFSTPVATGKREQLCGHSRSPFVTRAHARALFSFRNFSNFLVGAFVRSANDFKYFECSSGLQCTQPPVLAAKVCHTSSCFALVLWRSRTWADRLFE